MKELISKELIFLLVAVLAAIPVSVFFLWLVENDAVTSTNDESVLEMQLLFIGGVLGFISIYIIRLIAWAIKKVSE